MPLPVDRFVTQPDDFSGLYRAGEQVQQNRFRAEQLEAQRQSKVDASGRFLSQYLNPKDFLTGTNYDPEIVKQIQGAIQEGSILAMKGASTPEIMMALGPRVQRLNEYSTKAKLINQQIKDSLAKVKQYKGYNTDAMEEQARRMAFYDDKGQLKDISTVDPNTDWVTEVVRTRPELVTSGAGLDDFVARSPMQEYSKEIETMYAGQKRKNRIEAKHSFWEDIVTDDKGQVASDISGNPIGLDVVSEFLIDDDGKKMINPETNEPYKIIEKNRFNAIMKHNPDIADYIRGQVSVHFRELGVDKIPQEGTQQWELMARAIMRDELKTRGRGHFKTLDRESKTAPLTRIELGYPPYGKGGSSGSGDDTQIRDVYEEVDTLTSTRKPGRGAPLNQLSATAQALILDFVNKLKPRPGGLEWGQKDVFVVKEADGTVNIKEAKSPFNTIAPLTPQDINMKAQPGIKEKREVIKKENAKKQDPLGLFD